MCDFKRENLAHFGAHLSFVWQDDGSLTTDVVIRVPPPGVQWNGGTRRKIRCSSRLLGLLVAFSKLSFMCRRRLPLCSPVFGLRMQEEMVTSATVYEPCYADSLPSSTYTPPNHSWCSPCMIGDTKPLICSECNSVTVFVVNWSHSQQSVHGTLYPFRRVFGASFSH